MAVDPALLRLGNAPNLWVNRASDAILVEDRFNSINSGLTEIT
jgi:hypothetical protein